tara:strand:+ start:282 stop:1364 length:1083 start_codon:yes stop_codon:yes gene_type:complete
MKIELKEITVKELSKSYQDNAEEGVVGYDGKLDIRPPFQREFVYKDKQRNAVIDTITKDFPLNVMYWSVRDDGNFEIIDGQQRTISICQYVNGDFSYNSRYFHNLTNDEQNQIHDYRLQIYQCSGTVSEKLEWFKIINIAGEKLYPQELRNAVYFGSWVSDAKRYFSKTNCAAYNIAQNYVIGSPIRQEYLEKAIDWISKGNIEEYMAKHQHDQNANKLWNHFRNVINWVETTFKVKRKQMKTVDWGSLYLKYKDEQLNTDEIEEETKKLLLDDDVTKKSGIYPYILTRDEKYLSIRAFSENMKQKAYELQKGICVKCKEHFEISEMEADHITPWHEGGKTTEENCQMLCKTDNRRKSGK